jgi:hypothetical protein
MPPGTEFKLLIFPFDRLSCSIVARPVNQSRVCASVYDHLTFQKSCSFATSARWWQFGRALNLKVCGAWSEQMARQCRYID